MMYVQRHKRLKKALFRYSLHIFGFYKWESVKSFIFGLGRLNLLYIIKLYRIRFLHRLLSLNHTILYNLLFVYFTGGWMTVQLSPFVLYLRQRVSFMNNLLQSLYDRETLTFIIIECCRFFFRCSCYSAQYCCGK